MPWLPETIVAPGDEAQRATTADARLGYRVLLGREPEDREALLTKRSLTFPRLVQGFLSSNEFRADVAGPVMAGADWGAGRFATPPDPRTAAWAARHLATGPQARGAIIGLASWRTMYAVLAEDAGFGALLSAALGASAAEQFQDGLTVALARDATARSRSRRGQLPADAGPRISVVIVAAEAGVDRLVALIAALRAQSYGRFEVILVDDGAVADVRIVVDALAGFGPRVKVDSPTAGLTCAALLRAGVDVASGDYLFFPRAVKDLAADTLADLAVEALAQGRPPVVVAHSRPGVGDSAVRPWEPALVSVTFAARADDETLIGWRSGEVRHLALRPAAAGASGVEEGGRP